ncbi:MAG: VacJ family lipoprotein [Gammaproteobacteria bacterium]|nr:VacJ family lipoprotein [Gammaproteobacteria bacterium]
MTLVVRTILMAASLAVLFSGCATTQSAVPQDPWEHFNRSNQRFNDAVDRGVLKPVAKGYRRYVPQVIRTGISNFIGNLKFTTTIVNDLLQLKLLDTGADIGRFVLNSTLGIGGLLDPATRAGIRRNEEDFGQTLGRWGVPAGPYIVLPLLGPSTLRDTPAIAVDWQTDLRSQLDLDTGTRIALWAQAIVVRRESLLSADETLDSAFDRYAFIRDAWLQRREYLVRDGDVPEEAPLELEPEEP